MTKKSNTSALGWRPAAAIPRLLLIVVTAATLSFPAIAQAAGPSLGLSIATATAGARISFRWSAARLPRSARVVFQRAVGTGKVWRNVVALHGNGGSATAPALTLGVYPVRVVAITRGRVIALSQRRLRVFGQVPLIDLFPTISGGTSTQESTTSTGSGTFTYLLDYYVDPGLQGSPLTVNSAANDCRAIHFNYLPDAAYYGPAGPAGLSIVQQAADPSSSTAPYQTVGVLDAALTPGQSWALNLTETGGVSEHLYIDGYGSCDSSHAIGAAGFEIGNSFDHNP